MEWMVFGKCRSGGLDLKATKLPRDMNAAVILGADFNTGCVIGHTQPLGQTQNKNGGGIDARQKTTGCQRRHCPQAMPHGPAGSAVQNVTVPHTLMVKAPCVITRGTDRKARNSQSTDAFIRLHAVLNAHMPKGMHTIAADGEDVAPEIDQRVGDAKFFGDADDLIDGIFLAKAAEVEAHAFTRQEDFPTLPLHVLPLGKSHRSGNG